MALVHGLIHKLALERSVAQGNNLTLPSVSELSVELELRARSASVNFRPASALKRNCGGPNAYRFGGIEQDDVAPIVQRGRRPGLALR